MKRFLLQFFTWWNGATLGTRFYSWRKGTHVGDDEFGNSYHQSADGRRWVLYAGEADPSSVPPGWSGWLHYRFDEAPPQQGYVPREWELPHRPNMTGTAHAYRPRGSIARVDPSPGQKGDYEAWTP